MYTGVCTLVKDPCPTASLKFMRWLRCGSVWRGQQRHGRLLWGAGGRRRRRGEGESKVVSGYMYACVHMLHALNL